MGWVCISSQLLERTEDGGELLVLELVHEGRYSSGSRVRVPSGLRGTAAVMSALVEDGGGRALRVVDAGAFGAGELTILVGGYAAGATGSYQEHPPTPLELSGVRVRVALRRRSS